MSSKAHDAAPSAAHPNTVSVPIKPTMAMIEAASRLVRLTPREIVELYNAMVRAALAPDAQADDMR
ncbi:hypothetical protein [Arenibaculum pallidiluteum]|uniref:hypothetical protein n=1 Tax=Arenibaculum pallidiluteum TaxID=2812559 RepID=UPI001A9643B2|nr:hypothetical protein [Arenibaculum pallidiluteum]